MASKRNGTDTENTCNEIERSGKRELTNLVQLGSVLRNIGKMPFALALQNHSSSFPKKMANLSLIRPFGLENEDCTERKTAPPAKQNYMHLHIFFVRFKS